MSIEKSMHHWFLHPGGCAIEKGDGRREDGGAEISKIKAGRIGRYLTTIQARAALRALAGMWPRPRQIRVELKTPVIVIFKIFIQSVSLLPQMRDREGCRKAGWVKCQKKPQQKAELQIPLSVATSLAAMSEKGNYKFR